MPIEISALKAGDKVKLTISGGGEASISTTGTVIRQGGRSDTLVYLDCAFKLNSAAGMASFPAVSSKAEVKDAGFDAEAPRCWYLNDSTVIDEIVSSKLKPGERVKCKYGDKWYEATFITLNSNGKPVLRFESKDVPFIGLDVNGDFVGATRDRIRAVYSDLAIMDTNATLYDAETIVRIDIDPTTLQVGDVVEAIYDGKTEEATVISVVGTGSYPVVLHSPTATWADVASSCYGNAIDAIKALGLSLERAHSCVIGWKKTAHTSDVPVIKRLIKRPSFSDASSVKIGDKLTILDGSVLSDAIVAGKVDGKLIYSSSVCNSSKTISLDLSKPEHQQFSALTKAVRSDSYSYHASAPSDLKVVKVSGNAFDGLKTFDSKDYKSGDKLTVLHPDGTVRETVMVCLYTNTAYLVSSGRGLNDYSVKSDLAKAIGAEGLDLSKWNGFISRSENGYLKVLKLEPAPKKEPEPASKKEPELLDLSKEDLQPGDRLTLKEYPGREAIVIAAARTKHYGDDLLVALSYKDAGSSGGWTMASDNPFMIAADDLGIDTTKYAGYAWVKSATEATSVDRSRRIDPKAIAPGHRVVIEIADEGKVFRHNATVITHDSDYTDYAFETPHTSSRFSTGKATHVDAYVADAKRLGLDPEGIMLRDFGRKFRVVKELPKTTRLKFAEAKLKPGDAVELEIEGKKGEVLKRTATYVMDTSSKRGWCWLDAPILEADTKIGYKSLEAGAGYTSRHAMKELGLSDSGELLWEIEDGNAGYYTYITKIVSRAEAKAETKPTEAARDGFVRFDDATVRAAKSGARVEIQKADRARPHMGTIIRSGPLDFVVLDESCKACTRPDVPWSPNGSLTPSQLKLKDEAARFGLTLALDRCDTISLFPKIRLTGDRLYEIPQPTIDALAPKASEAKAEPDAEAAFIAGAKPEDQGQGFATLLLAGAAIFGGMLSTAIKVQGATSTRVAEPEALMEEVDPLESETLNAD